MINYFPSDFNLRQSDLVFYLEAYMKLVVNN